jgi:hypothetical protein
MATVTDCHPHHSRAKDRVYDQCRGGIRRHPHSVRHRFELANVGFTFKIELISD